MSARATRRSTKQGDLVFTDDPEAITRRKGKVQYTPAPTTSTTRPRHTEPLMPHTQPYIAEHTNANPATKQESQYGENMPTRWIGILQIP